MIINVSIDKNSKKLLIENYTRVVEQLTCKNAVEVSVYVSCYNHERYLRQTLDSIVYQNTNFGIEILIHDDCSTDNSRQIITEYEKRFPDSIVAIFERENTHSKGITAYSSVVLPLCRGKYLATCEGDDYWIDNNKLTKQIAYLNDNPDCVLVFGNSVFVDQNDQETQDIYGIYSPKMEQDYSLDMFALGREFPGQTASAVIRKSFYSSMSKDAYESYFNLRGNGDTKKIFGALLTGRVHIMSDYLSAYRIVTHGSTSWSSSNFGRNGSANRLAMELDYKKFAKKYYSVRYKNNWKIFMSGMGCVIKAILRPTQENLEVCKEGLSEFPTKFHFVYLMAWYGITGLIQKIRQPSVRLLAVGDR